MAFFVSLAMLWKIVSILHQPKTLEKAVTGALYRCLGQNQVDDYFQGLQGLKVCRLLTQSFVFSQLFCTPV